MPMSRHGVMARGAEERVESEQSTDLPFNTVWHLSCNSLGIWLLLKSQRANPGEVRIRKV
jgi:hypothetical protein